MSTAILQREVNLAPFTTLGARAIAERVVYVRTLPELRFARQLARVRDEPFTVLGGGSNVIPAPYLPGVTALMRTRGIDQRQSRTTTDLIVAAGENWHGLVRYSLAQGLAGLEGLALIPGLVGAAPVQNIGAYGSELAEVLRWVEVYDLESDRLYRLTGDQCALGYRDSRFKQPGGEALVIVQVGLRLHRGAAAPVSAIRYPDVALELARLGLKQATPLQLAEAVIRVRRRKLPDWRRVGNVGSTFKNPTVTAATFSALKQRWPELKSTAVAGDCRLSAAQLIDLAGQKSRQIGQARPWHRQPLVLTLRKPVPASRSRTHSETGSESRSERRSGDGANAHVTGSDGSSVTDFLQLAATIREAVRRQFAVELELEPQLLGPLALPPADRGAGR